MQVYLSDGGIGDSLLALTTCAGLQRDGKQVFFCPPSPTHDGWIRLFGGYDHLLTAPTRFTRTVRPYDGREWGPSATKTRAQLFAARCGTTPCLPEFRMPGAEAQAWAKQYRGSVVLAPWCTWSDREWPAINWHGLSDALFYRGRRVLVADGNPDRDSLVPGEQIFGESPERIAALADVTELIGNDSGLAHFYGLRRRPAIVICGHTDAARIFDPYPSVRIVRSANCRLESVLVSTVMEAACAIN